MMFIDIARATVIGVGATVAIDLWNAFISRAYAVRSLNYCLLGRWMGHIQRGVLRHANIATAEAVTFECLIGWIAHYSIGVGLSVAFVAMSGRAWLEHPTAIPAIIFGILTVAFPFFVLQPALGLGVASSATPNPTAARLKSLMTHAIYGVGLFATAKALVMLGAR